MSFLPLTGRMGARSEGRDGTIPCFSPVGELECPPAWRVRKAGEGGGQRDVAGWGRG